MLVCRIPLFVLLAVATTLPAVQNRLFADEIDSPKDTTAIDGIDFQFPANDYREACAALTEQLKDRKSIVVWLFDQSASMRDDQAEIRKIIPRIFEELGQPKNAPAGGLTGDGPVFMAVTAFGKSFSRMTKKPTNNVRQVAEAIGQIVVDKTGIENTCQAVHAVIQEFSPSAKATKRKLVVVVVTDESPSDSIHVEQTIALARRQQSAVYVMGREATFGLPYARFRWVDPIYKLAHWIQIDRGPETAAVEVLQFNGFGSRVDSFGSGFGPYSLVRLVKESGGQYLMLPSASGLASSRGQQVPGKNGKTWKDRYAPAYSSRREHQTQITRSRLRSAVAAAVKQLDPRTDRELIIRTYRYPLDSAAFRKLSLSESQKAARSIEKLQRTIQALQQAKKNPPAESSIRWKANLDLTLAQCQTFRMRLIHFLVAVDQHAHANVKPKNSKSNRWNVARRRSTIEPDDAAFSRIRKLLGLTVDRKEFLEDLKRDQKAAEEALQFVVEQHPATPWARMARYELGSGKAPG